MRHPFSPCLFPRAVLAILSAVDGLAPFMPISALKRALRNDGTYRVSAGVTLTTAYKEDSPLTLALFYEGRTLSHEDRKRIRADLMCAFLLQKQLAPHGIFFFDTLKVSFSNSAKGASVKLTLPFNGILPYGHICELLARNSIYPELGVRRYRKRRGWVSYRD